MFEIQCVSIFFWGDFSVEVHTFSGDFPIFEMKFYALFYVFSVTIWFCWHIVAEYGMRYISVKVQWDAFILGCIGETCLRNIKILGF